MRELRETKWMWVLLASWMLFAATTLCAFACEVNAKKASLHSCCPEKNPVSHSTKCCDEHNLLVKKIASPNEVLSKQILLLSAISYANSELNLFNNKENTYFSVKSIPENIPKVSKVISNKAFLL